MKVARFVLKIVAAALAVATAVCCVIAFWDKIEAACGCAKEKLCKSGCCHGSEYDDYVDWDAE